MRRPRLTTLLAVTGVLLVLIGIALLASSPYAAFGWYDINDGSIPVEALGDLAVMTSRQYRGGQLATLGLVVVAGAVGYALGRRRR
ncbi:hypothetical protein [Kineococcus sp. SYSU DK001]|uniref:hypothetical protein n=1 Tax=Kineococcus sp. SYSU DK001 TaxID=3383122 RepID=UPI003D7C43C6